ncbi:preprotein translocase subunit SecY [Enterobacteriaceae endosymbiont of Neohaemonia nigricornis]|uniref:preprotein translocase subunit SecY n=1 Tax=Enterobacteriaceae endosymbiont of Neohaemonia nigricornis TaxID=2675792 RepID=UPI001448E87F|nr:preprotein translocase subunit SecY [Enterobacteriaceae endosymbiont of Neohaemonia nigricornis]QJC30450.1 preprotein translocase subunit SecY [Enterobacteriaceae endosymbiont of Neohaemonia nigricornis]
MTTSFKQINLQSTQKGLYELKKRFIFFIFAVIIFRIGSFIPIPGINVNILHNIFYKQNNTILNLFNIFSGGSLSRSSVFVLGVMPYISSSIIFQLLTSIHPKLIALKREGESGQKKINKYIKYTALTLSIIQSLGITTGLPHIPGMENVVLQSGIIFVIVSMLTLITGTMFLMWLGNQITNRGIGNGVSIMIVIGILSSLPSQIQQTLEKLQYNFLNLLLMFLMCLVILFMVFVIVFIESGQRKILVHYAKQNYNKYIYNIKNNTHLPLKLNMSGVIPTIFAASIILFTSTILFWCSYVFKSYIFYNIAISLQPSRPLYIMLYISSIAFFCFFYTIIIFNPKETANNLKKTGAYIPGIRPGMQTAKYITKILIRLNFAGSLYISFICLIPTVIHSLTNISFYLGGTSLLIVVVVIMEFITQVQTIIMSSQYESIMKKINFKTK